MMVRKVKRRRSPQQQAHAISADLAMGRDGAAIGTIVNMSPHRREKVLAKFPASIAEDLSARAENRRRSLEAQKQSRMEQEKRTQAAAMREAAGSPRIAACSNYTLAALDPNLSKADRQAVRELRDSMISIGEVAHRLGVSKYRVDKLDKSGELPHARKKYIRMKKGVWARVWLPSDVAEFAEMVRPACAGRPTEHMGRQACLFLLPPAVAQDATE